MLPFSTSANDREPKFHLIRVKHKTSKTVSETINESRKVRCQGLGIYCRYNLEPLK